MCASVTKSYPYPVLSPNTGAYTSNCAFKMVVRKCKTGLDTQLAFTATLDCHSLQDCVDKGTAAFAYRIECVRTGYRRAVQTREPVWTAMLPHDKVAGKVRISPFVVATDYIEKYTSSDFHPDCAGCSYDFEPGCILAEGPPRTLDMELDRDYLSPIEPIFTIIRDDNPEREALTVEATGDRIRIAVPASLCLYCRNVESREDPIRLLNSLVVLPALAHVLNGLDAGDESLEDLPTWLKTCARVLRDEFQTDLSVASLDHGEALDLARKLVSVPATNALACDTLGHLHAAKNGRTLRVPFVSCENIAKIKNNLPLWADCFAQPPSTWLDAKLGMPFLEETRYEFPAFSLDMSAESPPQTDATNARIVYENMQSLPLAAACDERLWVGLCLGPFWEYAKYRLSLDDDCEEDVLRENLFFAFGERRSLMRNVMSRLWWAGHFTHDSSQKDPWKLTSFVCSTREFMVSVLERNTSNNISILRPFVNAVLDGRAENLRIDRGSIRELSKYLTQLDRLYLLDCTPEPLIHDKVLAKAREVCRPASFHAQERTYKR